ncbi:MAG: hypothetical protein M3509_10395, partial [Chloroflexota bacterium]|nr:hypothetical protein [Chloroflexota bacterium]
SGSGGTTPGSEAGRDGSGTDSASDEDVSSSGGISPGLGTSLFPTPAPARSTNEPAPDDVDFPDESDESDEDDRASAAADPGARARERADELRDCIDRERERRRDRDNSQSNPAACGDDERDDQRADRDEPSDNQRATRTQSLAEDMSQDIQADVDARLREAGINRDD